MFRELQSFIATDIQKKIILLSGPRQSGKTTLAKSIKNHFEYLNYDLAEHRLTIQEKSWDRRQPLLIFDELHKMQNWKQWLKGLYDTESPRSEIIVTGSAKMDIFRKAGDSLAGRFFSYRMHPFDCRELRDTVDAEACFNRLWSFGGFPEPFLENNSAFYQKWKRSHIDVILRQDLLDLTAVTDISSIETLIERLRYCVGSPISYASLARDLQKSPKTIAGWLSLLENLYVIFRLTPYHDNIARAVLKEPKYYFYDSAQVIDDGAKLENIVACALLKEAHFLEDTQGDTVRLHYLRSKDGRELDFIVLRNKSTPLLIEVKSKESTLSPHFKHFRQFFPTPPTALQLVHHLAKDKTYPDGSQIRNVIPELANGIIKSYS